MDQDQLLWNSPWNLVQLCNFDICILFWRTDIAGLCLIKNYRYSLYASASQTFFTLKQIGISYWMRSVLFCYQSFLFSNLFRSKLRKNKKHLMTTCLDKSFIQYFFFSLCKRRILEQSFYFVDINYKVYACFQLQDFLFFLSSSLWREEAGGDKKNTRNEQKVLRMRNHTLQLMRYICLFRTLFSIVFLQFRMKSMERILALTTRVELCERNRVISTYHLSMFLQAREHREL